LNVIEAACGRTAEKVMIDVSLGDAPATYADIDAISEDHGYSPSTSIDVGIPAFVNWFRGYKGF
jgi:UDP-glucuronate 4-epimerase